MSFPRYYHLMAIPNNSGVETGIECNSTMWDVSTSNDVEHSYQRFYAIGTDMSCVMDVSPDYPGAPTRTASFSPNHDEYEIGSNALLYAGKRYKFTNYIRREDFDAVIEWIRTNTIYNHTGTLEIYNDPDYAKTSFAMFNMQNNGSYSSAGWIVPSIAVTLQQRQYDEAHDCYMIALVVSFSVGIMSWTGTKWNRTSSWSIYHFQNNNLGELEKTIEVLNKCYNELGKIYVSLGPYSNSANFQVGQKYYRRFTDRGKGYSVVVQYDNPKDMGKILQTKKYFYDMTASSSAYWTQSGTVDPDDPTETPTPKPPNPDEPDPPNPPIDPPDIPPSEIILPPDLPPINASSNGFFTAWNPSIVTLRLIGDKLWSSNIIQQFLNSIFSPMDTILGLGVIPVQPTTQTGDNITVHFGFVDSEVKAPMITSDYVRVDCGSVYLTPYYADYLDYEPYTKMSLFIPYVGEFDLNPDEVTGKTLRILCTVNVLTGELLASVLANGSVIYQAAGNCMRSLPVTSGDLTQIVQAGVAAAGIIAGAALGGAAAAGAAPIGTSNALAAQAGGYASTGEAATAAMGNAMSSQTLGASANSVMGAKMHYHRAGQMGTGAGQLGNRKPFITILRPNLMLPDGAAETGQNSDLKAYKGYPCNQIMPLTNASGMTVVEDCRLSIPGATDEEVAEALAIMKGGYIA